jgi:GTP-binding protein
MFIDSAKITISAGRGGDGAVAFHREKYVASGGPDGGDGGRGGNVVLQVDDNLSTLSDFRYKRKFAAGPGENGRGKRCNGKSGADLVIHVPRGTLLKDAESGRLIADLSSDEPQIIAKGGRGGWGNARFATATRQTPRFAKPGGPGESFELRLELKLLADVGVVGYPNVGKSTLVSVVSEAKPQIANYHFTTVTPVLGVVRLAPDRSFVIADIPGLIEGANEGAGLGHQFLRHVERCRLLVHIVDVSGSEGRDPKEDFTVINSELKKFNPNFPNAPCLSPEINATLRLRRKLRIFGHLSKNRVMNFFLSWRQFDTRLTP